MREVPGDIVTFNQQLVRYSCVFFNVLCGLTNGYDICVTSVVLEQIVGDFGLCSAGSADSTGSGIDGPRQLSVTSCAAKQAILSTSSAGSLFSKLCLAWFADHYGRRAALALVDCMIMLGVLFQCLAESTVVFFLGRFALGVGIGLAFIVEPTYVCEVAPADRRGQYVVLNEVAVCVGCLMGLQLSANWLHRGGGLGGAFHLWRLVVGLGAIPAFVQLIFLGWLPESPRWLAVQGEEMRLLQAVEMLGLPSEEVNGLLELAGSAPLRSGKAGRTDTLYQRHKTAWGKHRASFTMALVFSFFNTASGIYAMQGYARDILHSAGMEQPERLMPGIGWLKLLGSLVAVMATDSPYVGRRRLATTGGALCALSHLFLALRLGLPHIFPLPVAAVFFFLFIFGWNIGYGSLQFAATLELLPSDVRSLWAGMIFAVIGMVEILINQLFETLLLANGMVTLLAFAGINGLSAFYAAFIMTDVGGRPLEEGSTAAAASSLDDVPGRMATSPGRMATSPGSQRYDALADDIVLATRHGSFDIAGPPLAEQPQPVPAVFGVSVGETSDGL